MKAVLAAALGLSALPFFSAVAQAKTRDCAVCGKFYPAEKAALQAMVSGFLKPAKDESIVNANAILVPHAGYTFSGETAGKIYRRLPDSYTTVIIIGTAHTTPAPGALITDANFKTPLGLVKTDKDTMSVLAKNPLFRLDHKAHAAEHSIEVQLPFLQTHLKNFKIIPVVIGNTDTETAMKIGRALTSAVDPKKTLCVISSDLSHYADQHHAALSDQTILKSLEAMDPAYFDLTDRLLLTKGIKNLVCAVCGKQALAAGMAYALASGAGRAETAVLANSAQSPYGSALRTVGYGGVFFMAGKPDQNHELKLTPQDKRYLLHLARESIHSGLLDERFQIPLSNNPIMNLPAAVFVTLTKDGQLRGCIGTVEIQGSLDDAVAYFARAAALADYRFPPVSLKEESKLSIEISILSKPHAIADWQNIQPGTHGVTVSANGRTGVFLPQVWETIKNKEEFLSTLCTQKAGLPADCYKKPETALSVFTVISFSETDIAEKDGVFLFQD